MKLSIIIPVYFNEENLKPLYEDIKKKIIDVIDYDYELVMVNDGSKDASYEVMRELAAADPNIKTISLSRNFGSHAAILCGLAHCTGDCAVVKAADLQEPTEMILAMVESWRGGNNVVLAVREGREEKKSQTFFAGLYYGMVRKTSFPNMPETGFDVYLIDRKVIDVLNMLDEKNSALTGQILWSGFRTACVYYKRQARQIGKSRWTLRKKLRLVTDTLFSFSTLPIKFVSTIGFLAFIVSILWGIFLVTFKFLGLVPVRGWTALFVFNMFSFGVVMLTLGILGEYLWRTFDATRKRPPYIIEEEG
jgi:dolichol-phosphate mannosyltransferase